MEKENYYSGEDSGPDKKIAESFRAVERSSEYAKERVRSDVALGGAPARRRFNARVAVLAGGLCFAAALAVIFLRKPPVQSELAPDWRAAYNFPAYSAGAAPALEESPDWRSAYQFPGYHGGRDTSGL